MKLQAAWTIGNVIFDSVQYRDSVLEAGVLHPLLELLSGDSDELLLRPGTWLLRNLCRRKPRPDIKIIRDAIPVLAQLLMKQDEEVLSDACWTVFYLSDESHIDKLIGAGVCPSLVQLLKHPSQAVMFPALRTVSNIVGGDDLQTQVMISCGVLPCLLHLMTFGAKNSTKIETCFALSNITAGTKDQIQAVIDAGTIPPLVHVLNTANADLKKEAVWVIWNAMGGGQPDQIKYFVFCGVIKPLCDLLKCSDDRIKKVALNGLEKILSVGKEMRSAKSGFDPYIAQVINAGGLDKLQSLWEHGGDIDKKAQRILASFFF